jgi:predicted AlkP superfamily pyrophosphatase or phosphodiesterase
MLAGTILSAGITATFAGPSHPKLVVVISIDQFPYEYLTRFSEHFGEGGFRYLTANGAVFSNAQYEHAANLTGPGHAVIATGCYGRVNGIVANNWYNSATRTRVNCVEDTTVRVLGARARGVSPALLLMTTIGDALKRSSPSSRVVSVSMKDRSAILMGGKSADAAYWLVDSSFVTSTYYMETLPSWVREFNRSGLACSFFGKTWDRILPEQEYAGLDRDDPPYEGGSGVSASFPHRITGTDSTRITPGYFGALWNSPYLNDLLIAFVKEAMVADSLGIRGATDMLCIGLSANDAVGHTFGPHSHEVLDMTVRTDRLLADLFSFIDEKVGLAGCLVVMSSDHGIAPMPEYTQEHVPGRKAGRTGSGVIAALCEHYAGPAHGPSWIASVVDGNIYLDRLAMAEEGVTTAWVATLLADSLRNNELIGGVMTAEEAGGNGYSTLVEGRLRRGFHPGRSGDIVYALQPYFIDYSGKTGTDHGQPYEYDAHVPVIFAGADVRAGTYDSKASPADIAPTLAALLGISLAGEREGTVLQEVLK